MLLYACKYILFSLVFCIVYVCTCIQPKNKKVEAGAREAREEKRRIHTSEAEKSQQSAEIYASVVTNLLYATATAASRQASSMGAIDKSRFAFHEAHFLVWLLMG